MPVRITITVDTESGAAEVRTTGAEQAAGAGTGAADPPTLTPRRDDGSTAAAAAGASDAGSPAAPEDIGDPGAASTEVDTAITPPREVPAGGDDARDDDDADVDRPRAVDDLDDGDGGGKTPAKRAKKTTRAKKTARKRS